MKKLVFATLLGLTTVLTSLLLSRAAKADRVIDWNHTTSNQVAENYQAADHPHAYPDGYRQGEQSFRNGEAYKPRTAGGEFARGFEDGYFNRPYTGQEVVLPPPTVIYSYPNPAINLDFGFGFGGWHHRW